MKAPMSNYSPKKSTGLLRDSSKKNMRKAEVVTIIAEKTGIPKVDVLVTLESFFKEVKEKLAKSEPVNIRGFGSFVVKKRAAKVGRNIQRNVAVDIPEHFVPAFRPAKEFVALVREHAIAATDDKDDLDDE